MASPLLLMHMADSLLAPAVAAFMYIVTFVCLGISISKIKANGGLTDKKIPVMAVMAAFVFAAQMVNFTVPGTGSSGHLCGGMMLCAVLGQFPAMLSLTAVLVIQCLFFADGGLMALGCNIFNMGVCAILIAYPLVFKPIMKKGYSDKRVFAASILACEVGLQLGAFCVVLETSVSGITALPFGAFVALMQPIHLAIALVEGIVTALVIIFIHQTKPELLDFMQSSEESSFTVKKLVAVIAAATLVVAGGMSLLASSNPDGLEWSILGITGDTEVESDYAAVETAGSIVESTAFLPDYGFANDDENPMGTTVSGIAGSLFCVVLAGATAFLISSKKKTKA